MKKTKLLSIILAVIMVLSISMIPAYATDNVADDTTAQTETTTPVDSSETAEDESDSNDAVGTTEPSSEQAEEEESVNDNTDSQENDTPDTTKEEPAKTEENTEETKEETEAPTEEEQEDTTTTGTPEVIEFSDVKEGTYYFDAVKYVAEKGIMIGVGDKTFAPDTNMTRAMAVMVLYNIEGKPEVEKESKFEDVTKDAWYANAVAWAEANNITNGVSETSFAPDEDVTREQFATLLYRYAVYKEYSEKGIEVSIDDFADSDSISEWALNAVKWAFDAKVMRGTDKNTIEPLSHATRAHAATMLQRFCDLFNEVEDETSEGEEAQAPENTEETPEDTTETPENSENTEENSGENSETPLDETAPAPEDSTSDNSSSSENNTTEQTVE